MRLNISAGLLAFVAIASYMYSMEIHKVWEVVNTVIGRIGQ